MNIYTHTDSYLKVGKFANSGDTRILFWMYPLNDSALDTSDIAGAVNLHQQLWLIQSLKLEIQTDISKYLMDFVSMITRSDLNASHTCIFTTIMFQ